MIPFSWCWDTGSFIRQHWSWGSFILFVEVGRRGLLFGGVFYSFSLLVEWGSFIRGGRLFGRLEYPDLDVYCGNRRPLVK